MSWSLLVEAQHLTQQLTLLETQVKNVEAKKLQPNLNIETESKPEMESSKNV